MRIIWTLILLLALGACRQPDTGSEMGLTLVPSSEWSLPDLVVEHVRLQWSQAWKCGVDVHITVANHGTFPAENFVLSLHDQQADILRINAGAQQTITFRVSGEQMAVWMEASGVIDADNVVRESDESNNMYRHPLPYSAVPGMESIAICTATKNAPTPSPTLTISSRNPLNTLTPSHTPTKRPYPGTEIPMFIELPNLQIHSVDNTYTYVSQDCWTENIRIVLVKIMNSGNLDIERFELKFSGQTTTYGLLRAGETRQFEIPFDYNQSDVIELDPQNKIQEIYEIDNSIVVDSIPFTPTPPTYCTPTSTVTPT